MLNNAEFLYGQMDIDNNTLQYSYKVTDTKEALKKIEKAAILNKWLYKNGTFSKNVNIYENGGENMTVKITESNNKIIFEVKSE